jgi:hypothetical protein
VSASTELAAALGAVRLLLPIVEGELDELLDADGFDDWREAIEAGRAVLATAEGS